MAKIRIQLHDDEYKVITKIAKQTRMDCWFCIGEDKQESLIFFVRPKDNPTEPFVTVEYSLKNKKILQCYAKGNTTPDAEVTTYINSIWTPYANRVLKKIA